MLLLLRRLERYIYLLQPVLLLFFLVNGVFLRVQHPGVFLLERGLSLEAAVVLIVVRGGA
jgi:hypothetical protein